MFEPAFLSKEIRHADDGWHVYSQDGTKHLGGPYSSKDEALARLRQVEAHKDESIADTLDALNAGANAAGASGAADPNPYAETARLQEASKAGRLKLDAYQGIPIAIDRPKGFVQTGKAEDGTEWSRTYSTDYGYIQGTEGGDGEELDVFVGDDAEDKSAHWAIQRKADGTFDEYKVLLGAGSRENAEAIYLAHIPREYLGAWHTTTVDMMKALLGLHPVEVMKRLIAEEIGKALAESEARGAAREAFEVTLRASTGAASPLAFIAKADAAAAPEKRYVLGPVLVPETKDGQEDIYSADEIERTAWLWASDFRNMGLMHRALVNDKIQWVESYIARADQVIEGAQIKAGTWMLGAIIKDEELWQGVKKGAYTGWSIGGFAKKTPLAQR